MAGNVLSTFVLQSRAPPKMELTFCQLGIVLFPPQAQTFNITHQDVVMHLSLLTVFELRNAEVSLVLKCLIFREIHELERLSILLSLRDKINGWHETKYPSRAELFFGGGGKNESWIYGLWRATAQKGKQNEEEKRAKERPWEEGNGSIYYRNRKQLKNSKWKRQREEWRHWAGRWTIDSKMVCVLFAVFCVDRFASAALGGDFAQRYLRVCSFLLYLVVVNRLVFWMLFVLKLQILLALKYS